MLLSVCVSVKRKTFEHPKAYPIKRAAYQIKFDSFKHQGYLIVYIDESGFEVETIRTDGYSPIGNMCRQLQLANKKAYECH